MQRRAFLTRTAAAAGGLAALGAPRANLLAAAPAPTLVVVFQRGGCDGLNVIVPHGDDSYYALRPRIAIPPPGAGGGAIDLDGLLGLHPRLAPLYPHYAAGSLAIFPATHHPVTQRSHFASQDLIETALAGDASSGWLGRFLAEATEGLPRGLSLDNDLPLALAGASRVASYANPLALTAFAGGPNDAFIARMAAFHDLTMGNGSEALDRVIASGRALWGQMDLFAAIDDTAPPANGAAYPDTGLGRRLRRAVQVIRAGIGLEVITIDSVGWDTHSYQGGSSGRQADQLGELAESIAAFWQDLGAGGDAVVMLTMTEFGRAAGENGSFGTDHGNASAWLALGPRVNGGIYAGAGGWPGLSESALHEGRDLAHTVDFRDIFAEILTGHFQVTDLSGILPGHQPSPIGFL